MLTFAFLILACGEEPSATTPALSPVISVAPELPPEPVRQPLTGEPRMSLLVAQAWFYKGANGKPKPGPARLEIWRQGDKEWEMTRLEDPESNVFHKVMPYDGGLLSIGAENAKLKKWSFLEGQWQESTIWEGSWGGKFNRLRDIEIGDVDGDGRDELVIATHDAGVVAVIHPDEDFRAEEMDEKSDTFVHEIEIGDIDGDGVQEFFATPSDRNKANHSQTGALVMYKWNGSAFIRTVVDPFGKTHAKEILATDIDGDGITDLFSVVEAELIGKTIVKPVEIRQYKLDGNGEFQSAVVATIDDRQMRFLLSGDFDQDGRSDLIAASMKAGLFLLRQDDSGTWKRTLLDKDSSGFEHTAYGADLNGDGALELYVAADDQGALNCYRWNAKSLSFDKERIGEIPENTITWNIVSGRI